tara:strand:- start:12399 stop:12773 length:375 start_codon:yes stop_codon:yes gene_type:complete
MPGYTLDVLKRALRQEELGCVYLSEMSRDEVEWHISQRLSEPERERVLGAADSLGRQLYAVKIQQRRRLGWWTVSRHETEEEARAALNALGDTAIVVVPAGKATGQEAVAVTDSAVFLRNKEVK